MKTLNELFSSLGCDEDSGWELLQHQGSPKKIAFELMPTLVELQSEPELWRLIQPFQGAWRVSPSAPYRTV